MSMYIGTKKVSAIYYGNKKVTKVYNGYELVFNNKTEGVGEIQGSADIYIAYDAGDNGAIYQFYDSEGYLIDNPIPGTAFRSYTVTGKSSTAVDRYYCLYSLTSFYDQPNESTWSSNVDYSSVGLGWDIGSGRASTANVIAANTDVNSAFYKVDQMNKNKVSGYSDWFIPSGKEVESMMGAIPLAAIWGGEWVKSVYGSTWIFTSSPWTFGPMIFIIEGGSNGEYYTEDYDNWTYEANGVILATRAF